ncbi:methyltransferase domain-containing protein [Streptomyces sp. NPDC049040]|uniref:methyltransferase domain-containing protein n=1 Tax=Streptomyces sp. NPDC049040 TaxID=3365593 RepID=UPI003722227C
MIVNAGGAYGHLALAGRGLGTAGMAGLSVVWAVAFSVGIGLFFPLEQELTRTVAARVAAGTGTGPLLRRGAAVAAGLLSAAVLLLAAAHRPLAEIAFDGNSALLWPLGGALSALAAAHTLRGLLAGHARFAAYACQLTLDGLLRLGSAAALLLTGTRSPTAFALVLTTSPLLACLPALAPALRAARASAAPLPDAPTLPSPAPPGGPHRPAHGTPTITSPAPAPASGPHAVPAHPAAAIAPGPADPTTLVPALTDEPQAHTGVPAAATPAHTAAATMPSPPTPAGEPHDPTTLTAAPPVHSAVNTMPPAPAPAGEPHDPTAHPAVPAAAATTPSPPTPAGKPHDPTTLTAAPPAHTAAATMPSPPTPAGEPHSAPGNPAVATAPVPAHPGAAAATAAAGRPGGAPPPAAGEIGRGLVALVGGAVFAQVLANAPVLGAKGLAPGDAALVTALLCALTLVRVPQFAVGALQAGLLRELTVRQQRGDRAGVARGVRRSAGGMAAIGLACTVPAALAGPWVTERLLAAPPVLGHLDFAALGLGTTGYLVAYLLGNGTLATGGHRPQALAWAAGAAVTAAALALPGPTGPRVEAAYALGSWTAAALLAARLIRTLRPDTPAKGALMSDTATPDYTARLLARRLLPTQAPYRWNLRRLRLGKVLDVGCGVGRNLRHCAPGSVGVDHNAHSVAAARARGLTAYTPEEFAAADFPPGSFDSLLCAHVLEHLEAAKASALLSTYLPYVRPGGRAVLITPQEAGFASDATHVRFVGFAELTEEARAAGLDVRRAYSFPLPRAAGRLFRHNEFVLVSTAPQAPGGQA